MTDKTEKTREIQAETAPEKTVKKAAKGVAADQTESRAGKAGKTGKAVKSAKAGSAEKKKKTAKTGRGAKKTVTEKMTIEERLQGIPAFDLPVSGDRLIHIEEGRILIIDGSLMSLRDEFIIDQQLSLLGAESTHIGEGG